MIYLFMEKVPTIDGILSMRPVIYDYEEVPIFMD